MFRPPLARSEGVANIIQKYSQHTYKLFIVLANPPDDDQ
jgi:hypothetical protein